MHIEEKLTNWLKGPGEDLFICSI